MTPPDVAGWNLDCVESILLETAKLAEIRMVQPSDVYGSFLPALYFADNFAGDTVATNFSSSGTVLNFKNP